MHRTAALAGVLFVLGAGCGRTPGTQASQPAAVYFSNWAGEIGPDTLPEFERRSGVHVAVDDLVDNVTLQTRLLTGHSGIDVAVPGSNFLGPLIEAGALRKLDRSRLPNWRHLDPAILAALGQIDPGNQYGVPYVWGTQAFAYNHAAVAKALGREPEPSWKLIFDPAYARRLASCGIAWQDSAGSIMADLGLLAIGRDPAGESAADLTAVEDAFMRVRPYVRYIDSSDRFRTDLASGEICIAIGSNGELLQTRELAQQNRTGVDVHYVVPVEGALMWVDLLVIPVDAPHPDEAYRLLDYLLEPEAIAGVSNASRFANANRDATALVDPGIRDDPAIYPPPAIQSRLHLVPGESQAYTRLRSRMWTRVRDGVQ